MKVDDNTTCSGSGLLVTAKAPTDKNWQTGKLDGVESAAYSDLTISMSGNTFEGCAIDYNLGEDAWEGTTWKQSGYIKTSITPLYNEAGELLNGGEVVDAVNQALDGAEITFNGTAEEFAELTSEIDDKTNMTVTTKDGAVTPGVTLPDETLAIGDGEDAPEVALAASYVDGEYYYLVVKGEDSSNLLYTEEGELKAAGNKEASITEENSDNYLWTVKSATSNKHDHIDYVFVNKAGVELELCSANKAAYDKRVLLW